MLSAKCCPLTDWNWRFAALEETLQEVHPPISVTFIPLKHKGNSQIFPIMTWKVPWELDQTNVIQPVCWYCLILPLLKFKGQYSHLRYFKVYRFLFPGSSSLFDNKSNFVMMPLKETRPTGCPKKNAPLCSKAPRGLKKWATDKSWVSFEKFRKFPF